MADVLRKHLPDDFYSRPNKDRAPAPFVAPHDNPTAAYFIHLSRQQIDTLEAQNSTLKGELKETREALLEAEATVALVEGHNLQLEEEKSKLADQVALLEGDVAYWRTRALEAGPTPLDQVN